MSRRSTSDDPLWFKDAVIYELPIKSFYDSNDDGVGDLRGLLAKLDYVRDLGVNCLWLLPFFVSPLKDDGYDIADYLAVNPKYGNVEDFRKVVEAAHVRGLRVVMDLVLNHTSDEHPWFQRARLAPAGSPERDFYVWSDSAKEYSDVRVIFTNAEPSNWTWDQTARAYFWHRFFHHQPDLNYRNPRVLEEILKVMDFWCDLGVDGFRLDAVPYLAECEGTACENLPETHAILKTIRRHVDEHWPNRLLLAEANQLPEEVRDYFGDGDECHMAYHFPVMPRLFMAIHLEERDPVVDVLRHMPEIPDTCQWALFLRNHDELTLEKVSEEERSYMYLAFSADPQARVYTGIRRRLAPLLANNRRRIELLTSVLLSLPGTPVLYYGDEIGMGDNTHLGDRNGVRTPMQWSGDRNAGFSRAAPERLYSPVIVDPVSGYQAANVEAEELEPGSLLNWMRNMIRLRRTFHVFGRGTIEFLEPANRKVLAYVRRYQNEIVLCIANLARTPQAAALDLAAFAGFIPVEMLGYTEFPGVTGEPWIVTLGPYGFYWLELQRPD
jgi:maltose alpha-D-glucosyltransferase / alpha-amylase